MEFSPKMKNRTTIRSNTFSSGYLPKENKSSNSKRYIHPYVHCSITYSSQDMGASKCPSIGEWIKKMCYVQAGLRDTAGSVADHHDKVNMQ